MFYEADDTRAIVSYESVRYKDTAYASTFQVVLYPSGEVHLNYLDLCQAVQSLGSDHYLLGADDTCPLSAMPLASGDTFGLVGGYSSSMDCSWAMTCADGETASISFSSFATEGDWDYVYVYDGEDESSPQLSELHGSEMPDDISSTEAARDLDLTTDGRV